ncbi:hypothetical protein NIES37_18550 [Tolypothrix tenuis PCC 7101]|uniref:DUF58 domain-containing protein n=1 Tax=Tolypothrix tenuis PCC 7101 TaxID=231146 RepID=A0A1Z4MWQ7_9CYAN|nr:DUF58 domain-containing protein [Aulosira sp. FACHB-113]BAY97907.1 hypothetical protein NIES37_18550 [Tolypothrix tenuis PCC 7101]BAZ71586.1 hypothetical protein NIES50_01290 [Aulosira laxa NIES-50]
MVPADRVYILLVIGIAIAPILAMLFGIYTSIGITLLFDIFVLALMVVDGLRVRRDRIEVSRQIPSRLSIGRDNPVVLTVKSGNTNAVIKIRDYYPTGFGVSTPELSTTVGMNSTQELTYTVHPTQRGEFAWGNLQVRQLGFWGLAWNDWQISQNLRVKVYPDLVGLRSLSIRLALQSSGSIRQRRMGIGTEFAELRNYRTGDDLRLVDWKATARRVGAYGNTPPLVRVLEPEQEQTLIILLDRGRLMTAKVQGLQRFDWGLNATLSLALAGLHRGDRVGVGVFDRQMHTWIPPERGQNYLPQLIDRLTPIQPVLLESDYLGAVTNVVQRQTRRALVVLITDIVDVTASTELLAALSRLAPRYLPFCVTLRDPQVDRLAHTFTENVTNTYVRAVALDLLAQRQVAFAQLKQKGVLVLDAPAHQITDQLVERYLQLKARNQL